MPSRLRAYCFLFLSALFLAGCAGLSGDLKQYGSFEPDRRITQAFERYEINPDLNYYYSGSDVYPGAIMGLGKLYTLDEPLWKRIHLTPRRFKALVEGMQKKAGEVGLTLSGWSMRDEKGREIGVWYSVLFATTTIRIEGDNKVVVSTPGQGTYIEYEGL